MTESNTYSVEVAAKIESDSDKINENENAKLLSEVFPEPSREGSVKRVAFNEDIRITFEDTSNERKSKNVTSVTKQKRKRRLFSCDSCRNLKTKCILDAGELSCRRCTRLCIPCSLPRVTMPSLVHPSVKIETQSGEKEAVSSDSSIGKDRIDLSSEINANLTNLFALQQNSLKLYENLHHEMSKQSQMIQQLNFETQNRETVSNPRQLSTDGSIYSIGDQGTPSVANFVDLYEQLPIRDDINAPLNLISEVKISVLGKKRDASTTDFQKANQKFIQFYLREEQLCLELAKEFLEISHYYIIPGGISDIDRDYVLEHPMITCVFVLIVMLSSKKYKHSAIQLEVETLLKDIICTINNRDPVSDHDIESILYICLYNLGRLDKWMLSTTGLMHFFISIDTRGIIDRVVNKNVYTDDDLFHLRILNLMCFSHLQNAIGKGRSVMIEDSWWKIHRLTVIFPNATVGDAIQVAQLDLFKMIVTLMNDKEYFLNFDTKKLNFSTDDLTFICEDLFKWQQKWSKIISKDVSKIIKYSYCFAYILISRKFIDLRQDANLAVNSMNREHVMKAYKTASYYSFELLKNFLESEFKFIRGIPSFQLQEIVYACVTLFEYLTHMTKAENEKTLNIISKTYWHLNKMGQELNDATGTIAEIIKKLVEMARKNEALQIAVTKDKGFIGSGSVTRSNMYKRRKNSQQQKRLSPEDLPLFSNDVDVGSVPTSSLHASPTPPLNGNYMGIAPKTALSHGHVHAVPITGSPPNGELFQLPDLSNFSNFDDFFKDLFREH
jgi:hypothetical protein